MPLVELMFLIALVAALYSSVGHGGASGYLAALGLMGIAPQVMSSTALVLNVGVAFIALLSFASAGHFRWGLVWPFLVASVPAAFLGGRLALDAKAYYILLGIVLLAAAARLLLPLPKDAGAERSPIPVWTLGFGSIIGLVSGVVGIGGGIFLSPFLILARWASAKEAAAASAMFILANSLAGLGGRAVEGSLQLGGLWPLIPAALVGGVIGSSFGSRRLNRTALCRVLAGVMGIAAFKLILQI
jgi:uncharacterized protein